MIHDDDPCEAYRRHQEWLIATCLNGIAVQIDRGDLRGALESVEATIAEDSGTEAQLSGWREHLQELVAEQEKGEAA